MTSERWRQVEKVYHAALERSEEGRLAYLDRVFGQDSELRKEVESLLALASQAQSFLESRPQTTLTMALNQQIGPYRILGPLGAGGMGEVYRAHDSKLGRDVALKSLPHEFARDTERLARFRREARTLASLNHPNIAAIYGLEESDGATHLVLELVEGETLRGPVAVDRALEYARQVAEGLDAAHEKGIIHRDLKPANVKVTPKDKVKILDFGLAKAVWGTEEHQDFSQLRTRATATQFETILGQIVGAPAYMSPEQARGKPVDQRADIWAFGCLLYELLTGKRAFESETLQDTVAAVLEDQPNWSALPAKAPSTIRELLRKCLEKDPGRRLAKIAEARRAIEKVQRPSMHWPVAAVSAVAVLAVAAVLWTRHPNLAADPSQWVQITRLPDSAMQPAFSPDGHMLAFLRGPNTFVGGAELYLKILPDGEPVQLTHDKTRKMSPVFSPDGSKIVYTVLGGRSTWDTWTIPALGGTPELWLPNAAALTWTGPREILYSAIKSGLHMGIVASPENRLKSRDVYVPTIELGMAHKSYLSPDHKWILAVEMDEKNWMPCRLAPYDGSSLGRQVGPSGPCTSASWSQDGKWMYFSSAPGGDRFHIWRQRFPDGKPEQVTFGASQEEGITISPDGRSLVTAVASRQRPVWFHDSSGDRQISLEAYGRQPMFYAGGSRVYYIAKRADTAGRSDGELWVSDLDSGRNAAVLPGFNIANFDISEDGRLLVCAWNSNGKPEVWLTSLDHRSPPKQIPGVETVWALLGPPGEVYFLSRQGSTQLLFRIREDGSGVQKLKPEVPIVEIHSLSADSRWITGLGPVPGKEAGSFEFSYSTTGRNALPLCNPPCRAEFAHDGKSVYFELSEGWMTGGAIGRTYVLPTRGAGMFPNLPAGGFQTEAEIAAAPGAHLIEAADVRPGPSSGVYVFSREVVQRNLYRIPLQ